MRIAKRNVLVIASLALAACLALAVALVRTKRAANARHGAEPVAVQSADPLALAAAPHLLFRSTGMDAYYSHLSIVPGAHPDSQRGATSMRCERVSFAAGRGICLQADRGVFTTYSAVLFDERFQPLGSLTLDGSPSRTRVSPDGRIGAITVFVTGQAHGYASVSFSTKTILIDMATGAVLGDLEQFKTSRDGRRFSAPDFNFWGVTFARDSNAFYASLKTAGKVYLVRGDLAQRTLTVLHENVECPSLSPNNRLIAYKKRIGGNPAPWRFFILDVASMTEHPIAAESRSIDDQIEWLDDAHVLYGAPHPQSAIVDVWAAPVDGNDPARIFLVQADSPVVVH